VANNILKSSRGILFRVVDQIPDRSLYPEARREHQVSINNKILHNTLSNTSGLRPAYITLDAEAFAPDNYRGLGMLNMQVAYNTVNSYARDPSQTYDPKHNEISQEGLFPCFLFGPAPAKDPVTTVFRNVYFWGNSESTDGKYTASFGRYTSKACVTSSVPPSD
jgi:hypothetical protein